MARNSSASHTVGARAVGGGGARRRPAWLWPLLALLALLLIAALLISLLGGDDDKKKGDSGNRQANAAALTVGGQPLTPAGIEQQVGQDASGKGVVVQQIIPNEGFFVGTSKKDSVYIEYGGAAGKSEGGYKPKQVGEKVNLDGPVRPAPEDPTKVLRLPAAEAAKVKQHGAYINANAVQRGGQ